MVTRSVKYAGYCILLIVQETKGGSVNAPHHHHHEFTVESITKLLNHFGLQDVHAEVRGTMRIWRDDQFHDVDCLIARGRKAPSAK
jgi:hypothetical protein